MLTIKLKQQHHFGGYTLFPPNLIFELVRTPNIFSCTKLEMNLVWDNCNIDVTSFAGKYKFDMQLLTIFSSKLSELELLNGSNVWKQTFRGEMVKNDSILSFILAFGCRLWKFHLFFGLAKEKTSDIKNINGRERHNYKGYDDSQQHPKGRIDIMAFTFLKSGLIFFN